MKASLLLSFFCALTLGSAPSIATPKEEKQAISPAANAKLEYRLSFSHKHVQFLGDSTIDWSTALASVGRHQYKIQIRTNAQLIGRLYSATSEGYIEDSGLAPTIFSEVRLGKSPKHLHFNYQTGKLQISSPTQEIKLLPNTQDIMSAIWQMGFELQHAKDLLQSKQNTKFAIAAGRAIEKWEVNKTEKVQQLTALGPMQTWHVQASPLNSRLKKQIEVWFAPSLDFHPVRIRFQEPNGDYIEQRLVKVQTR